MKALTSSDIRRELPWMSISFMDLNYGIVEHAWLEKAFTAFWKKYLQKLGAQYTSEKWDCDKYARAFQSQIHLSCLTLPFPFTAAVGMLRVSAPEEHALNIARTDRGWFEYEPQNCKIVPLRSNTSEVRYAMF